MAPAPSKTQRHRLSTPATLPSVPLRNPALDQLQSELARQNRQLDEAASLASGFAGVPLTGSPGHFEESLEQLEQACIPRAASRGVLLALTRC